MIKVYGMSSCPYCAYVKPQIEGNPKFVYRDIGEDVHALKEFLDLRDSRPEFIPYKEEGDVGIPCFLRDDGTLTLEPKEVGLVSLSEHASCNLDGTGC